MTPLERKLAGHRVGDEGLSGRAPSEIAGLLWFIGTQARHGKHFANVPGYMGIDERSAPRLREGVKREPA